jgi:hypothetical protein
MRYCTYVLTVLALAGAALAGAPPQYPNVPPAIVPSPTTHSDGSPGTGGGGGGGNLGGPPAATPEPATLTIALVSVAAAGSLRLLRRKW